MFWTCPTPTLKHPPLKANQAGCFHDGSATFERISALFSSVSLQVLFHIQRCVGVVRVLQTPSNNTCLPLDSCRSPCFTLFSCNTSPGHRLPFLNRGGGSGDLPLMIVIFVLVWLNSPSFLSRFEFRYFFSPSSPFRIKASDVHAASCRKGGGRLAIAVYNHASTFSFIQSSVQATQTAINTH